MRKHNLIGILVVVLFLFPMLNTSSDYNPAATYSNPDLPQITDTNGFALSSDRSTGVAPPLPVTLNGQVSNVGQGTLSFDSSSSGVSSVTLSDGWTGTDLQAQINSLTWTAEDVLQNGDLNDYHNEQYIVSTVTTENDDNVRTPDGWTLVKDVVDDNPHPNHGYYELQSNSGGKGGTWGVYLEAQLSASGYDADPNDEIYFSQMVSMPYRELSSAQITFDYRIDSASYMDDIVHLFVRLAGYTYKYHVFESGDTTDTWLTTVPLTIPASQLTGLSTKVMRFDIGLATDENGFLVTSPNYYAYIDNVQVDLDVRPFPEQIDLKANGTLVWGSTLHSTYPYVPDDDDRDCYDDSGGAGIDLDGYANDGVLDTGIYSSGYLTGTMFETGMQFPLDIPQGAIITSAYLEVEAASSSSPYLLGMRVHVADEDNVESFSTIGPVHLEDRFNWVETSIDWYLNSWITSVDTRYRSPDLGPLVQNVVSRSGWSEGNYICIMTSFMYSDYYQRWNGIKGTYGYDGEDRARLFVEYIIPEPEDTVIFFDYQKDITVDHLDVAADLTNFPVLIDITDTDLRDHVLSNGNDVAFSVAGNPVAHEIELYEETTGHLIAWVKIPSLSSSIDTVITMHYGCLNAPPPLSSRVWDDYETVQHLNQDPSGINYDSTSNNHDGTSYGGLSSSDLVAGQIGNAISFDGTDDVISIGQIDTDEWSQFTMSAWIYRTIDKDARIFSKSITTTPANHIITLRLDPTNAVTTRIQTDGTGGFGASYNGNQTVANYTWNYISWSWSAARGSVIAYLNGNPVIEVAHGGTTIFDSDAMFVIGNNDLLNDRYWAGMIDEARLTTSLRSEAWIDTEYNNQLNPSSFYTVGSERTAPDTWSDAGETQVVFTTSSPTTVTMDVNLVMDIGGEVQTMDENFDNGVSYFIESGASVVNWTAKVMVSPPAGATSLGFTVEYPRAEWKATKVLNPLNQPKTVGQDWWYQGGTLTLNASSIDFWGVWTLKFISWNFMQDLQISNSAFNVNDIAQFTMTTPTVIGARVGLDLVKPDGTTWYSSYNETTGTDPDHKFPSFRYRKVITIPSAEIYGTVTDYPVLVQFTDTDLHDTSKVRSDASDILFASGDTILDHEIEYFEQDYPVNTALLVAWVKTNLTSGVDNYITMYYGSPVVDNLENPDGVWSNDFEAVWHLGEAVAQSSIHYDSSGNNYDGVRNGNSEVFARAGYGQEFDGIGDYIAFDETLTPENDILITGWFRIPSAHSASSPNTRVIMEKYIDIDQDMVIALVGQNYGQGTVPNGSLVFKVESSQDNPMYKWTQNVNWAANTWYFIACYADEDDPSNNKIWVNTNWNTDAGQVGSATQTNMSYIEEWRLGGGDFESSYEGSGYFAGRLDEFRVSNTLRSDGWLRNEQRNQLNTGTFLSPGTEQERTSPEHTLKKTIDSTAPAGEWTAIAYYNDTGTSVTNKIGLIERTFIVRHDTQLTLTKPADAVGDRLSVKTVGDALFVEYSLTDTDAGGNPGVTGATVTINWTSPSSITLDEYGGGRYGKVLDTIDLGDNKQWRVEVQSTHPYYNDATEYFNVDLYHATKLSASGSATTPADFIFNTTLTFKDDYTGAPITGAVITESDGTAVTFIDNLDGTYNISIPTSALSLGIQQYTFNATKSGAYLKIAQVDVEFTLRAHYTSVFVQGDLTTPHGENTQVTIFLLDMDTGKKVSVADVDKMTFSYSPAYPNDVKDLYVAQLSSSTWDVGTVTANLTITMLNSKVGVPEPYVFTIQILAHQTSVSVTGVTTKPYGNLTALNIVLTDLEDGSTVPIGSVSNIRLQHAFGVGYDDFSGTYSIVLDTSAWTVGSHTVTVVVTMSSTIYTAPTNYQFTITIRSMTSMMYHGPSTLNFTIGSDFVVNLRLNTSEAGPYYGNPVTGRSAGEFSVSGYVITIDTSQQAIGLYRLTIDQSYFTGGNYQITVYFTSTDSRYGNTVLVIQFTYREIISYLSSPNYPQVTTPYQLDVEITLEYADADSLAGIEGATITSPDHPTWIANWTDETGGVYSVWIDVSTLAKGTHLISLTADLSGFTARTLQFRIVIRDAYTSATPLVGSLDIPIGNSPFFFVDYMDLDRLDPIDNLTSPYTQVVSSWGNFSVEYISDDRQYKITFHTSDSDTIAQNQVYTFTFSKTNYQTVQFSITVTIRTHNTDFRIVSSIEPTSTIGIFNISVYYGDLDNTLGIKSGLVIFSVSNTSGPVISSYDYDLGLGDGFYIIQVPASQFGLGLQALTVYADWTGAVLKYQDKSFVTSANVVGRDSALTLLIGSEPTPYNEDMSYTFFYSDLFSGIGIDNLTSNVFIYVNFQGQGVNPSDIIITDFSATEVGKYSIEFNTGVFSRTGLIYMNVFVNWSKGVSPFYSNRTDVVSIRVLPRDTLLSITPASSTSYNENATIILTFEDITGGSFITGLTKQEISLNISFSLVEDAGSYTISFNTNQFGSLGLKAILVGVTWVGTPFYANRTGRIAYIPVIARITSVEYLTPPPTQYGDQVIFNVTWTDTTEGASIPITGATVVLKEGLSPIDTNEYAYVEISPGVYQITLNTTYAIGPGTDTLRVEISSGVFYYTLKAVNRQFSIQERQTIVAANPVADVPFGSSIIVTVSYLDLFTGAPIANDTALVTIIISGQTFTSTWRAGPQNYQLNISWNPSWDATWTPGTSHSLTILMDYAYQAPFYLQNQAIITFDIRIRESSLALDTEPETTPYLDDVTFTIFYSDDDAGGVGIAGADISIVGLTEFTDFLISEGSAGYYTITVFTTSLGSLGTHVLNINADWTGAPYHDIAKRDVSVLVRTRATNLEVTLPPSQTLYLDYVTFEFEFNDLDAETQIALADLSIIHLYWPNMTEINQLDYSIVLTTGTYEINISSTILSNASVTGLSIRVEVDWPVAQTPFYSDDFTIVKVTITGRSILVETDQIERTPKGDILNITVNLSDLDDGDPIEGAIIQFSCRDHFLIEGVDYTRSEGLGTYVFNIDTLSLTGTGTFLFDIGVQWNPNLSPFYSNRSVVTLTGLVDLVRASLQVNGPFPSSVQYTGSVSLTVTWRDLDHGLPISGYAAIIDSNVKYLISGLRPTSLVVSEFGSSGIYNITFSTSAGTTPTLGPYTLRITAAVWVYASVTVTPQFNVIAIYTDLTPVEQSVSAYWKSSTEISVDYVDLLNGVPIPSAFSVIWEYKVSGITIDSGSLTEIGSTGRYTATIDTSSFGAGDYFIEVTAIKDRYTEAFTTISLKVVTIPSKIIIHEPIETRIDVNRGDSVYIEIELWDINYGLSIDDTQVRNVSGEGLQVYASLNNIKYYMSYDVFSGRWDVTIPGTATILEALLDYNIRIFASFKNYDSAAESIGMYIKQTATQLRVTGIPDPTKLEVYYLQNVTLQLNFSANALDMLVNDGNVSWIDDIRDIYLNFTSIGNGMWTLTFNTSILGFGTIGVTFYGYPTNTTLAQTITSMTLTIKNVPTDVEGPTETIDLYWGWTGTISLNYTDTYNTRYVRGAIVTYSYGNQDFNATDLGNGTYTLYIDTTILDSNIRERISTLFFLPNFETQSRSYFIRVLERPTELIIDYPDQNFDSIEQDIIYLVLTMGDSIDISLFYNDTNEIGGLFGGIASATFSEFTEMRAPGYIGPGSSMPIIFREGLGYYDFTFDTNNPALYELNDGLPVILEGEYFRFAIEIFDEHRQMQTIEIRIRIITTPTTISHDGQIVDPDIEIPYTLVNGESIVFDFYLNDTWHNWGVEGASFDIIVGDTVKIDSSSSQGNGHYRIVILAVGYNGQPAIRITMSREFHDDISFILRITTQANDFDRLFANITLYGLPISIFIILLLGAYVKVWSVPKRIRQINGQLKALRKGKVPKPIGDVKSRQKLTAELFNDTFEELKITRTAAQMPEEAIPIQVPEMGELLMQLAILTRLSPEELDDFQADIAKMKMSEQAAFVKEVITQEAIRAARRDGKTIEETLTGIQLEAQRRLGGEEEVKPIEEIEPEPVDKVFLEEEEKVTVTRDDKTARVDKDEFEEVTEETSDKMGLYELEELRRDLERKGVPPHEIDTIIEQAKELPRELVDELIRSLEGKKK